LGTMSDRKKTIKSSKQEFCCRRVCEEDKEFKQEAKNVLKIGGERYAIDGNEE